MDEGAVVGPSVRTLAAQADLMPGIKEIWEVIGMRIQSTSFFVIKSVKVKVIKAPSLDLCAKHFYS